MNFGNRLKLLREEKGLLREDLATKLNLSYSAISKYETGNRTPDDEIKIIIAKFFDVTLDYLMGNSDIRNPYKKTSKEESDISTSLDEMKKQLATSDSLMFDGQPATKEQVQAILNAIEMGEAFAKQRAKEKFTPKKYRK